MQTTNGTMRRTAAALLAAALIGCSGRTGASDAAAGADPQAELMARGVELLYKSADPVGAETVFREVLLRNPTHYGANYQLAVALDRGGKPADARAVWQTVLTNAEAIRDSSSIRSAQARLQAPDTASMEALMVLGLDLLRRQNNAAAATEQFRKVLQRNPTHYGATYQLAMALDKAGQGVEARPLWQKVLGMATTYKDSTTIQAARQRLAAGK